MRICVSEWTTDWLTTVNRTKQCLHIPGRARPQWNLCVFVFLNEQLNWTELKQGSHIPGRARPQWNLWRICVSEWTTERWTQQQSTMSRAYVVRQKQIRFASKTGMTPTRCNLQNMTPTIADQRAKDKTTKAIATTNATRNGISCATESAKSATSRSSQTIARTLAIQDRRYLNINKCFNTTKTLLDMSSMRSFVYALWFKTHTDVGCSCVSVSFEDQPRSFW